MLACELTKRIRGTKLKYIIYGRKKKKKTWSKQLKVRLTCVKKTYTAIQLKVTQVQKGPAQSL